MVAEHTIEMGKLWSEWEGQHAKIKGARSYASAMRIEEAGMRAELEARRRRRRGTPDKPGKMAMILQSIEVAIAWVEELVTEWNLVGIDGSVLPLSAEAIRGDNAPHDLIDQLIGEMSDFYEEQRPAAFRESASSD